MVIQHHNASFYFLALRYTPRTSPIKKEKKTHVHHAKYQRDKQNQNWSINFFSLKWKKLSLNCDQTPPPHYRSNWLWRANNVISLLQGRPLLTREDWSVLLPHLVPWGTGFLVQYRSNLCRVSNIYFPAFTTVHITCSLIPKMSLVANDLFMQQILWMFCPHSHHVYTYVLYGE